MSSEISNNLPNHIFLIDFFKCKILVFNNYDKQNYEYYSIFTDIITISNRNYLKQNLNGMNYYSRDSNSNNLINFNFDDNNVIIDLNYINVNNLEMFYIKGIKGTDKRPTIMSIYDIIDDKYILFKQYNIINGLDGIFIINNNNSKLLLSYDIINASMGLKQQDIISYPKYNIDKNFIRDTILFNNFNKYTYDNFIYYTNINNDYYKLNNINKDTDITINIKDNYNNILNQKYWDLYNNVGNLILPNNKNNNLYYNLPKGYYYIQFHLSILQDSAFDKYLYINNNIKYRFIIERYDSNTKELKFNNRIIRHILKVS